MARAGGWCAPRLRAAVRARAHGRARRLRRTARGESTRARHPKPRHELLLKGSHLDRQGTGGGTASARAEAVPRGAAARRAGGARSRRAAGAQRAQARPITRGAACKTRVQSAAAAAAHPGRPLAGRRVTERGGASCEVACTGLAVRVRRPSGFEAYRRRPWRLPVAVCRAPPCGPWRRPRLDPLPAARRVCGTARRAVRLRASAAALCAPTPARRWASPAPARWPPPAQATGISPTPTPGLAGAPPPSPSTAVRGPGHATPLCLRARPSGQPALR